MTQREIRIFGDRLFVETPRIGGAELLRQLAPLEIQFARFGRGRRDRNLIGGCRTTGDRRGRPPGERKQEHPGDRPTRDSEAAHPRPPCSEIERCEARPESDARPARWVEAPQEGPPSRYRDPVPAAGYVHRPEVSSREPFGYRKAGITGPLDGARRTAPARAGRGCPACGRCSTDGHRPFSARCPSPSAISLLVLSLRDQPQDGAFLRGEQLQSWRLLREPVHAAVSCSRDKWSSTGWCSAGPKPRR